MQTIKNNIFKYISVFFSFIFVSMLSPIIANASSGVNYYWNVKIMFENGTVQGEIIKDDEDTAWDEGNYGSFQKKGMKCSTVGCKEDGSTFTSNNSEYTKKGVSVASDLSDVTITEPTNASAFAPRKYKPMSFPGIDGYTGGGDNRQNDLEFANKINNKLTNAFNEALNMFENKDGVRLTNTALTTASGKAKFITAISKLGALSPSSSGSVSVDGYSVKYASLSGTEKDNLWKNQKTFLKSMGITESHIGDYFIKVAPGHSSTYKILQFGSPKGYGKNGPLYAENKTVSTSYESQYVPSLSWMHIAIQSISSYSVGIYSSEVGDLYDNGSLTSKILGLFNDMFNSIVAVIGADSIDDLIFSTGSRSDYYYGIAPQEWFDNVAVIIVICFIFALTSIGVLFAKNFAMGNLSILNPAAKANVMNGLMNILYALLGLTIYIPAISLLFMFNKGVVDLCYSLSRQITFSTALTSSGSTFGGIIVAFIMMIITIRLNISFIIRSIYIIVLYATGPIFIASLAATGRTKDLFQNWLKELLGFLFLQSFYAVVLVIYIKLGVGGSILTKLVFAYSFIPLGKWFRDRLFAFGGSSADRQLGHDGKGFRFGRAIGGAAATMAGAAIGGALSKNIPNAGGKGAGGMANVDAKDVYEKDGSMKSVDSSTPTKMDGVKTVAKGAALLGTAAAVGALNGNNRPLYMQGGQAIETAQNIFGQASKARRNANSEINKAKGWSESSFTYDAKKGENFGKAKVADGVAQKYAGAGNVGNGENGKDMHVSTASLSDGAPGFEANMPEIYNDKNAKGDSSNPFFDLADSTLDNAIDSGKFNDVLSEQNIDISTPQGRLDAKQYLNDNCAQEVYSSDNTYVKDALKSNSKYSDFSSCSNMVNGKEKEAQGIVGLKVSSSVNQHSNVIVRNNDLVTQGSESTITNGNRVAEKIISSNKNNAKTGN